MALQFQWLDSPESGIFADYSIATLDQQLQGLANDILYSRPDHYLIGCALQFAGATEIIGNGLTQRTIAKDLLIGAKIDALQCFFEIGQTLAPGGYWQMFR